MDRWVAPGSFRREGAYVDAARCATAHPDLARLFALDRPALAAAYARRHPGSSAPALAALLATRTEQVGWAGSDLLLADGADGRRRMVLLETNSCPSGQKAMPRLPGDDARRGYRRLVEALVPRETPTCAYVFDKNIIEAHGYAATLADHVGRPVRVIDASAGPVRLDGIDVALRYVTRRPWERLPARSGTTILNPVAACLAGGRNKAAAHDAYRRLNRELVTAGLAVETPETFAAVGPAELPELVARLGGRAVVKEPLGNAGEGVHVLEGARETDRFVRRPHRAGRYVVQRLVGEPDAAAASARDLRHVGTRDGHAFDLRMVVCSGPGGFLPVCAYARRAPAPFGGPGTAWERFGTTLSQRRPDGGWETDDARRVVLDHDGLAGLGLGLGDLVDAYVQTVLATIAIDRAAAARSAALVELRGSPYSRRTPESSVGG